MAKPWSEVAATPEYAQADAATKDAIRNQYFDQVVAPNVPDDMRSKVRSQFIADTLPKSTWQSFRPYVAPAVEMVGAVGGGLLGAPAGPLGAVAGAGLGYAGGKELLNIADTYFGQPEQPTNALARVGTNLGTGASLEMGGQAIAKAGGYLLGKTGNFLADMSAQNKAAKILRESIGTDMTAARGALAASPDVLPAQALAGQNLPEAQALAAAMAARNPKPIDFVLEQQRAKTLGELEALAKGSTQTETRASQEAAKAATNAALIPTRDAALRSANAAGELLPGLEAKASGMEGAAADATDMVRRFMPAGERAAERAAATTLSTGMRLGSAGKYTYMGELAGIADKWASRAADASLDLGAGARFARYAADSLAAHGLHPLESAPIIAGIRGAANDVSLAGNEPVSAALDAVAKGIKEWTNSGGVIDAFALDAIRKNSVNSAIQKNLAGADPKMQQKVAASTLTTIRPLIDDAIEAAGGTGYKQYLSEYSAAMQEQARTKLAGKALALYKDSPNKFVKLINGDAPKDVEKILGSGRYDISTELAPDAYATLKRAADGVTQTAAMKAQAKEGRTALAEIVKQNTLGFRIPFFSHESTAANALLDTVQSRMSRGTMDKLGTAFQSTRGVENLLKVVPVEERNALLRMINSPQPWVSQGLTGLGAGIGERQ